MRRRNLALIFSAVFLFFLFVPNSGAKACIFNPPLGTYGCEQFWLPADAVPDACGASSDNKQSVENSNFCGRDLKLAGGCGLNMPQKSCKYYYGRNPLDRDDPNYYQCSANPGFNPRAEYSSTLNSPCKIAGRCEVNFCIRSGVSCPEEDEHDSYRINTPPESCNGIRVKDTNECSKYWYAYPPGTHPENIYPGMEAGVAYQCAKDKISDACQSLQSVGSCEDITQLEEWQECSDFRSGNVQCRENPSAFKSEPGCSLCIAGSGCSYCYYEPYDEKGCTVREYDTDGQQDGEIYCDEQEENILIIKYTNKFERIDVFKYRAKKFWENALESEPTIAYNPPVGLPIFGDYRESVFYYAYFDDDGEKVEPGEVVYLNVDQAKRDAISADTYIRVKEFDSAYPAVLEHIIDVEGESTTHGGYNWEVGGDVLELYLEDEDGNRHDNLNDLYRMRSGASVHYKAKVNESTKTIRRNLQIGEETVEVVSSVREITSDSFYIVWPSEIELPRNTNDYFTVYDGDWRDVLQAMPGAANNPLLVNHAEKTMGEPDFYAASGSRDIQDLFERRKERIELLKRIQSVTFSPAQEIKLTRYNSWEKMWDETGFAVAVSEEDLEASIIGTQIANYLHVPIVFAKKNSGFLGTKRAVLAIGEVNVPGEHIYVRYNPTTKRLEGSIDFVKMSVLEAQKFTMDIIKSSNKEAKVANIAPEKMIIVNPNDIDIYGFYCESEVIVPPMTRPFEQMYCKMSLFAPFLAARKNYVIGFVNNKPGPGRIEMQKIVQDLADEEKDIIDFATGEIQAINAQINTILAEIARLTRTRPEGDPEITQLNNRITYLEGLIADREENRDAQIKDLEEQVAERLKPEYDKMKYQADIVWNEIGTIFSNLFTPKFVLFLAAPKAIPLGDVRIEEYQISEEQKGQSLFTLDKYYLKRDKNRIEDLFLKDEELKDEDLCSGIEATQDIDFDRVYSRSLESMSVYAYDFVLPSEYYDVHKYPEYSAGYSTPASSVEASFYYQSQPYIIFSAGYAKSLSKEKFWLSKKGLSLIDRFAGGAFIFTIPSYWTYNLLYPSTARATLDSTQAFENGDYAFKTNKEFDEYLSKTEPTSYENLRGYLSPLAVGDVSEKIENLFYLTPETIKIVDSAGGALSRKNINNADSRFTPYAARMGIAYYRSMIKRFSLGSLFAVESIAVNNKLLGKDDLFEGMDVYRFYPNDNLNPNIYWDAIRNYPYASKLGLIHRYTDLNGNPESIKGDKTQFYSEVLGVLREFQAQKIIKAGLEKKRDEIYFKMLGIAMTLGTDGTEASTRPPLSPDERQRLEEEYKTLEKEYGKIHELLKPVNALIASYQAFYPWLREDSIFMENLGDEVTSSGISNAIKKQLEGNIQENKDYLALVNEAMKCIEENDFYMRGKVISEPESVYDPLDYYKECKDEVEEALKASPPIGLVTIPKNERTTLELNFKSNPEEFKALVANYYLTSVQYEGKIAEANAGISKWFVQQAVTNVLGVMTLGAGSAVGSVGNAVVAFKTGAYVQGTLSLLVSGVGYSFFIKQASDAIDLCSGTEFPVFASNNNNEAVGLKFKDRTDLGAVQMRDYRGCVESAAWTLIVGGLITAGEVKGGKDLIAFDRIQNEARLAGKDLIEHVDDLVEKQMRGQGLRDKRIPPRIKELMRQRRTIFEKALKKALRAADEANSNKIVPRVPSNNFEHYTAPGNIESIKNKGILPYSDPFLMRDSLQIGVTSSTDDLVNGKKFVVFLDSSDIERYKEVGLWGDLLEYISDSSDFSPKPIKFSLNPGQFKKVLVRDLSYYSPKALEEVIPKSEFDNLVFLVMREGLEPSVARAETSGRLFSRMIWAAKNSWKADSIDEAVSVIITDSKTVEFYNTLKPMDFNTYGFYTRNARAMLQKYYDSTIPLNRYSGNYQVPEYWYERPVCPVQFIE